MQNEYGKAHEGNRDLNKEIAKPGELSKLAYEDLIFPINTLPRKVTFGLVPYAKSLEFHKGKC